MNKKEEYLVAIGNSLGEDGIVIARELVMEGDEPPIHVVVLYDPDTQRYVTGIHRKGEVFWRRTFHGMDIMDAMRDFEERKRV